MSEIRERAAREIRKWEQNPTEHPQYIVGFSDGYRGIPRDPPLMPTVTSLWFSVHLQARGLYTSGYEAGRMKRACEDVAIHQHE